MVVTLVGAAVTTARAQAPGSAQAAAPTAAEPAALGRTPTTAPFWRAAHNPDERRAETLVRQGRAQLYPALGLSMLAGPDATNHRRAAVENAITRFELARKLLPHDPEVLYMSAKALAMWERRSAGGRIEKRTQEAIARFTELREVDPDFEAYQVAFELGVLYTLQGDPTRAAEAYQRALGLRVDEGSSSATLSNLAEVTMMAGDLERAVELYEQSLAEGSPTERVLSRFGLAVALDRLGEHGEANAQAQRAIQEDQRPLGALRQSGVFFVPAYEAYYYEGLGLWALALGQAGGLPALARAVQAAPRALGAASADLTLSLKQVLVGLAEEGHDNLFSALRSGVERTLAKERAPRGPMPRSPDDDALDTNDTRSVLSLVQSARAFARFLDAGGRQGPWARDAEAHLATIASLAEATRAARATP